MAACQVCGKTNSDDARYCFSCGATLTQTPPVKVDVKSPITYPTPGHGPTQQTYPSRQVPKPGSCYYHADLPAAFVCARCGRSICVGCNRQYGMLTFCTECYWGLSPKIGYGGYVPEPYYQQPPPRSFF
jgi:hypothetical protein